MEQDDRGSRSNRRWQIDEELLLILKAVLYCPQSQCQSQTIEMESEDRILTDSNELNRVLGGGVVRGSLVLIGGDPGIGKSTLLLQVSSQLANKGNKVLYISGEESLRQTKLRAERLGVISENLYVYAETNLEEINRTIESDESKLCHHRFDSNDLSPGCYFSTWKCFTGA